MSIRLTNANRSDTDGKIWSETLFECTKILHDFIYYDSIQWCVQHLTQKVFLLLLWWQYSTNTNVLKQRLCINSVSELIMVTKRKNKANKSNFDVINTHIAICHNYEKQSSALNWRSYKGDNCRLHASAQLVKSKIILFSLFFIGESLTKSYKFHCFLNMTQPAIQTNRWMLIRLRDFIFFNLRKFSFAELLVELSRKYLQNESCISKSNQ